MTSTKEFSFTKPADSTLVFSATPFPLSIAVCSPRILRLRFGAADRGPESSFVPEQKWPPLPLKIDKGPPLSIDSGGLVVRLAGDPQRLTLCDRAGAPRLQLALGDVSVQSGVKLRFLMPSQQHFYGLGEGGQPLDRLGVTRHIWNCHINNGQGAEIPIPLLLSYQGFGLFFDNTGPALVGPGDSNGYDWLDYGCEEGPLDLYYLGGDNMRDTLAEAAALLGRAPLPPRWALGYLQSTRHFDSSAELEQLPKTLREKRLPCDGLIFLSTYGEARGWNRAVGHLECEPSLIPQPARFFGELRAQHFHVITHEYPVLHEKSPLFAEAKAKQYVLDSGYPNLTSIGTAANYREGQRHLDFSRLEAREWWWRQHGDLARAGVDAWWLDGGEGPPAATRLHGGSGTTLHNRYDLLRQQAFAEGTARDRPDDRVFLLCRSGGAGMQRFGASPWSGDINNTFGTLEGQIPIGLNTGMSGVPYWGTDVGGFYHVAPDSAELFVRWFQYGAFSPIFRAHGRVWRQHVPWAHGAEIENICRQYLELRYRLMPYTYTLAWQAHTLGLPLMRPLVLNYANDARVWDLGSEYLWGDDLLVAPVTREGATQWPVYLPEGRWHDFWTHEIYDGPRGITVAAPLDRLPLFVRAGAIVPIGPVVQYQDGQKPSALTLLVYPARQSSFTLYEDDGATNAYRQGQYALTDFECVADGRTIACRVGALRGDAALVPAGRAYTFQIHAPEPPRRVELEGGGEVLRGPRDDAPCWWHDSQRFLYVRVAGQPVAVKMAW